MKWLQAGSDVVALFFAFAFGRLARYWWTGDPAGLVEIDSAVSLYAIATVSAIGWFSLVKGHYTRRIPVWDEAREVLVVVYGAAAFHAVILLVTKQYSPVTQYLGSWAVGPFFVLGTRFLLRRALLWSGHWQRRTVVVGAGDNAREAAKALLSEPLLGFSIESFLLPNGGQDHGCLRLAGRSIPVIGVDSPDAMGRFRGCQIVMAMEADAVDVQQAWVRSLSAAGHTDIFVVPNLRGLPLYGMEVTHFFSHEVLLLRARNNLARRGSRLTKRFFDVVLASVGLIVLAPIFLAIGVAIRRSGRQVFYGHERIGRAGRRFACYKFRTMVPDAAAILARLLASDPQARAEWERDFKLRKDPRITRIGRFLRHTSLDELPQLWNVLRGEMSLVGPRPVLAEELERYGEDRSYYLQVRPGITGIWQISGRNDASYSDRVALDAWYVRNWSLWYDIAILLRTVSVVLGRKGAY